MNNYFNFKEFNNEYLITNDLGRYMFLSNDDFKDFVCCRTDLRSEVGKLLVDNLFAYQTSSDSFIDNSIFHYRNAKNYLFASTGLHIFVITDSCNMSCRYCQAQNECPKTTKLMSAEVAKKASDIALSSPQKAITIEFQGGEPLLNFEIIKYAVLYIEKNKKDKNVDFSIVTNLTLLTDEIIDFIKEHHINISTSIDGPMQLHNYNRPCVNGSGSFEKTLQSLSKLKDADISVGAIQTTTKRSLQYTKEIINTYVSLGFNNIFIRPLSPLGYAKQNWSTIGYTAKEFVDFYKNCFDYIISLNLNGIYIRENHAALFLNKILTGVSPNYMELRSPCGASVGQLAYYYDGEIFTCDEGRMMQEMGNPVFKLGDVFKSSYNDLMNSSICKKVCSSSVLESLPKCCDCVYQPYCGVCPVVNYAMNQDLIFRDWHNYRCEIYAGMLDKLFEVLQKNDKNQIEILRKWL